MAPLIQNCDLVIARSGAMTINELIKTQKPSILVPYPNSKNNHQEHNAMVLASIGGAIIINQDKKAKYVLKSVLLEIFKFDPSKSKRTYQRLEIMKKNMKDIVNLNSNLKIKKVINNYLNDL